MEKVNPSTFSGTASTSEKNVSDGKTESDDPMISSNALSVNSVIQATGSRVATQTGASSGQGRMRIDPLQLLTCLSILLNSKGGIKSIEEVQRVAGLMGKYSKKLVSKCIYLNILQATDGPLLDEFYRETGWNLVGSWLTEAMVAKNYPLTQQILSLLLISPISVERLKKNNTPKMVKDLSKECPHASAKATAEKVVLRWKDLVKTFGGSTSGLSADLSVLNSTFDTSISLPVNASTSDADPLANSNVTPSCQPLNKLETTLDRDSSLLPANVRGLSPGATSQNAIDVDYVPDVSEEEADKSLDEDYKPAVKAGRRRGGKAPRGGATRGRGRRKRGVSVRGRGKGVLSYAELLNQDLGNAEEAHISSNDEALSDEDNPKTNKPIKITIRSGPKVLTQVKTRGGARKGGKVGKKPKRLSIDSTDSDDNKPLSLIRDECQLKHEKEVEDKLDEEEEAKDIKEVEKVNEKPESNNEDNKPMDIKEEPKPAEIEANVPTKLQEDSEKEVKSVQEENDSEKVHKTIKRTDSSGSKSEFSSDSELSEVSKESAKTRRKGEHSKNEDKDKRRDSDDKKKDRSSKDKRTEEKKKDIKDSPKGKEREKDKGKEKHKSHHDRHHHHKDRDRKNSTSSSDKKSSSRDKEKEKSKDSDKRKLEDRKDKDKKKDHEKKKEQAEKDKATLDKIKPLSTEGLAKIPRKPPPPPVVSFLDALGSADSDLVDKRPPIKAKSRGFRNTGLFDEAIKPPGIAGKRTAEAKVIPASSSSSSSTASSNSTSSTFKRQSSIPDSTVVDKKLKTLTLPSGIDRPGGIKLISPKRPKQASRLVKKRYREKATVKTKAVLADDGGFMAALTAAGGGRKKIARKRKSSESDPKAENSTTKVPKVEKEEGTASPIKEETTEEGADSSADTKVEAKDPLLSPTSIKPTLNFYKETLKDEDAKEEKEPESSGKLKKEEIYSDSDEDMDTEEGAKSETKDKETDSEVPVKKDEDNMDLGETDENGEDDEIAKAPVPAPSQEEYEKIKIQVTFTKPLENLKSALIYHRSANKPKKGVRWKSEDDLKEIFLFPMDETERVNVNTIKFNEMMMMEKAKEKELMFGKHKNSFHSRFMHESYGGVMDGMVPSNCVEYGPYKLYPVHLTNPSKIVPGFKSLERHVQAQREHSKMAAFFHPAMLPDSPSEPDPEIVPREEPKLIPVDDGKGNRDNLLIPWPEPLMGPPEYAFMGTCPMPVLPPAPGGHWVQGNQPVARFDSGPMYGGPNGPGPGMNPVGYIPQVFPAGDMRGGGGWGGPPDFGGPQMMANGPAMMGPGMPGQVMQGPNMGNGMGMNMRGHGMNRGESNQRYRHEGERGGNWRRGSIRRTDMNHMIPCRHFEKGKCYKGNNCPFLHNFKD